jgi:anti-sigma28 factor (negative regulator of flagellin synthesis)
MRIDDTSGINALPAAERTSGGPAKATNESPAVETSDRADVTPVAEQAQGASPQRLDALRAAVESGNYSVSANDLARSIVDSHLKP